MKIQVGVFLFKCLNKANLISPNKLGIYGELTKIIYLLSSNTHLVCAIVNELAFNDDLVVLLSFHHLLTSEGKSCGKRLTENDAKVLGK